MFLELINWGFWSLKNVKDWWLFEERIYQLFLIISSLWHQIEQNSERTSSVRMLRRAKLHVCWTWVCTTCSQWLERALEGTVGAVLKDSLVCLYMKQSAITRLHQCTDFPSNFSSSKATLMHMLENLSKMSNIVFSPWKIPKKLTLGKKSPWFFQH